jgi:hypothetical protein
VADGVCTAVDVLVAVAGGVAVRVELGVRVAVAVAALVRVAVRVTVAVGGGVVVAVGVDDGVSVGAVTGKAPSSAPISTIPSWMRIAPAASLDVVTAVLSPALSIGEPMPSDSWPSGRLT